VDSSHINRLMEGNILGVPRRYVASTVLVIAVKMILAASLYVALGIGSTTSYWMDAGRVAPLVQNEILTSGVGDAPRWAYIFVGWDSAWYASIAAHGYGFSDQSFAFMPGFPLLTSVLQPLLGGVLPALAVVSFAGGVVWVPVFESVAEHYTDRCSALACTLLFAISPFTLLFTTVAYSEGLFLLLTLVAWKLYLDGRYGLASVAAALVALVRDPGFVIVLPMAVGLLASKRTGLRGLMIALPTALTLLLWGGVNWVATGDPLALVHSTEWSGMYTLSTWLVSVLPSMGLQAVAFPVPFIDAHPLLPAAIWISIITPPILAWRLRRIDVCLSIYCAAYLAGVLAFGAVASLPRFVAVLFPLWLPVAERTPGKWLTATLAAVSVGLSLVLWAGFLGGLFVG